MLSKLISAEKRIRTNGDEFYVCTFSYSQGAKDAPTFITIGGVKVLNPQAAAIRNINLVKCLFPTEDETAKAYKKILTDSLSVWKAIQKPLQQRREKSLNYPIVNFPYHWYIRPCRLVRFWV